MLESVTIHPAVAADVEEIKAFLKQAGLPTAGVDEHWKTFIVARDGVKLIGCGGVEAYPTAALLRSIAVDEVYQRGGVGRRIVRELLDRMASRGVREFYLLTETAEAFFRNRGFRKIDREEVNPQVLASREFQDACPKGAICMRLRMLT